MCINSYGGLPSLPIRYLDIGAFKPYLVTEFGPPGTWEIEPNSFDTMPELTSTEKAAAYDESFTAGCLEAMI